MKKADRQKSCFLFVHSHPDGFPDHSGQDDLEERKLFSTAFNRIRTAGVHASLIFMNGVPSSGRAWLEDGSHASLERIRIIGDRFRFIFLRQQQVFIPDFFDRQVRAFGPDVLLVSLGLDTFEADPISKFRLGTEDFLRLGELIGGARLPTLFVFEGGYNLTALPQITVNVLEGFESG